MKKHFKSLFLLSFIFAILMVKACGENAPTNKSTPTPTPITTSPQENIAPVVTVNRGAVLYKRCRTCHTLEENGRHRVGPNLYGIFGAPAAAKEGFNYSDVMETSGIIWTEENLMEYIENPKQFMPGNRMVFVGIRDKGDLKELIDYMRQQTTAATQNE